MIGRTSVRFKIGMNKHLVATNVSELNDNDDFLCLKSAGHIRHINKNRRIYRLWIEVYVQVMG